MLHPQGPLLTQAPRPALPTIYEPAHGPPRKRPSARTEPRPRAYLTPWRSAILLVADDKAGRWNRWYTEAIADQAARHRIQRLGDLDVMVAVHLRAGVDRQVVGQHRGEQQPGRLLGGEHSAGRQRVVR